MPISGFTQIHSLSGCPAKYYAPVSRIPHRHACPSGRSFFGEENPLRCNCSWPYDFYSKSKGKNNVIITI